MKDWPSRSAPTLSGSPDSSPDPSPMDIRPLQLDGTYEIVAGPRREARGYSVLNYDEDFFRANGLVTHWKRENQALYRGMGVVRGLYFQRPPHSETRLVRVVVGRIWQVIVDLRRDSASLGRWTAIELSEANHKLLYIPNGFAHGFCTLSALTLVQYKVDACQGPEAEGGIRWDDLTLGIPWPVVMPQVSARDRSLPSFASLKAGL